MTATTAVTPLPGKVFGTEYTPPTNPDWAAMQREYVLTSDAYALYCAIAKLDAQMDADKQDVLGPGWQRYQDAKAQRFTMMKEFRQIVGKDMTTVRGSEIAGKLFVEVA